MYLEQNYVCAKTEQRFKKKKKEYINFSKFFTRIKVE